MDTQGGIKFFSPRKKSDVDAQRKVFEFGTMAEYQTGEDGIGTGVVSHEIFPARKG